MVVLTADVFQFFIKKKKNTAIKCTFELSTFAANKPSLKFILLFNYASDFKHRQEIQWHNSTTAPRGNFHHHEISSHHNSSHCPEDRRLPEKSNTRHQRHNPAWLKATRRMVRHFRCKQATCKCHELRALETTRVSHTCTYVLLWYVL